MTNFTSLLTRWRLVRDTQVLTVADADHAAAARHAVDGALATSDEAMAVPLDALFEGETKAADVRVADSEQAYRTARI